MDEYSEKLKLIEYLYQVAIDPLCFQDMIDQWYKVMHHSYAAGVETMDDEELSSHIHRAGAILDRLEVLADGPKTKPLTETIKLDPNPAILISAKGSIIAANEIAKEQLGVKIGEHLTTFLSGSKTSPEKLQSLIKALTKKPENNEGIIGLLDIETSNSDDRALLALSSVSCTSNEKIAGLLTSLAPVWSKSTIAVMQQYYELTRAEIEVITALLDGKNPSQIGGLRETSVHTVRTQIKSILQKTNMDSQIDLIRHIGFMQRYDKAPQENLASGPEKTSDLKTPIDRHLILRTGIKMDYTLIGPKDGRPALFIHGMIDSPEQTNEMNRLLLEKNIRLIAPMRPGFGNSDPNKSIKQSAKQFASHAVNLLDELQIEKIPVIGHMAGAIYGHTLAGEHPDRITATISVAGGVPIISRQQIFQMSNIQRLGCLNAIHAPALLPMFIKGGIALIRNGREDVLLKSSFKDAPVDMKEALRPEVKALLFKRYRNAIKQGHKAFQGDAIELSRDWSKLMEKIECPVIIIHGEHDKVFRIETVKAFAAKTRNCTLVTSPDAGQLILSQEPEMILRQVEAFLEGQMKPATMLRTPDQPHQEYSAS